MTPDLTREGVARLRASFEKWARTVFNDCDVVRYQPENGGQYVDPEVRRTWAAYQAATERAAKVVDDLVEAWEDLPRDAQVAHDCAAAIRRGT